MNTRDNLKLNNSSAVEVVPCSAVVIGNTINNNNALPRARAHKQIAPSVHWCFTLNNYTSEDITMFANSYPDMVSKIVFQEEKGENGTPHLQGSLSFRKRNRPMSVFPSHRVHWEKTINVDAAFAYCQKSESAIGRRWSYSDDHELIEVTQILDEIDCRIKSKKWGNIEVPSVILSAVIRGMVKRQTHFWLPKSKNVDGELALLEEYNPIEWSFARVLVLPASKRIDSGSAVSVVECGRLKSTAQLDCKVYLTVISEVVR